jgi:hypothetical protein
MAISLEHDPEKHALELIPRWKPVFRKHHAHSSGSPAFVMAEGWLNDLQIVP